MKPFLIGIAGPSCSGKTTLIKNLEDKIGKKNLEIIHADDYWDRNFIPPLVEGHKNRELPQNIKLSLLFENLKSLKKGIATEVPFDAFTKENGRKIIQPMKIIIVEGFLLFYDKKIRDLFDLKIYLDLPDEEIIRRRTERNRSGKNREAYYREVVISEYRKYGLPAKKNVDLILEGTKPADLNIAKIIRKIEEYGICISPLDGD